MNKIKTVLIVVTALMLSVGGYAQTVTQSPNGAIIDCSALKSDGFTKTKKARTTNGSNTTGATESAADIGSQISNEKVYYKLEVLGTDSGIGLQWKEAIDFCAGITTDGGGWRLPTQRELILVWVLYPELKKIRGFTLPSVGNTYGSATQSGGRWYWVLSFSDGFTTASEKDQTNSTGVRCVRDL